MSNKMRPYWQDYTNHMMRLYVAWRQGRAGFMSETSLENLRCVMTVLANRGNNCADIMAMAYETEFDMEKVGTAFNMSDKEVWRLIRDVSKEIALERGLIE